jgi:hypothetical protein
MLGFGNNENFNNKHTKMKNNQMSLMTISMAAACLLLTVGSIRA